MVRATMPFAEQTSQCLDDFANSITFGERRAMA
jgi:hypothetical protein